MTKTALRTHTCGELRVTHVGQTVTLCGWVRGRRDHGKLTFLDLRDRYGLTQVVVNPREAPDAHRGAEAVRDEFVLQVTGRVERRPPGTVNPKLPTGEVELVVQQLTLLNASLTPPFPLSEEAEVGEELRLSQRYLDLRRPDMQERLLTRDRTTTVIRQYLHTHEFIEVETPILTKSTPEGARDFLVPSRLNPGQFYALPQSPQLFKQLLMVAGLDRYFQIARCFRDEDLRADRQPEFTQLDLEMSFVNEEDLLTLIEGLMAAIFKELGGLPVTLPFPRLSYAEAMKQFGTDKPDLQRQGAQDKGLHFLWVTEFPLLKYNTEEQRLEAEHHPFTSPREEDLALLDKAPERVRARAYDLVLNGVELGSGSVRIHRRDVQERLFKTIGLSWEEAKSRFGFLLDALEYGAPPHAGFALGLDRLVAILAGADSIREVMAFPKTQKGVDLMSGAPSAVSDRQLKELHLSVHLPSPKLSQGGSR